MEGFSLSEWSTDRTEGAVFVNQSEVRRWFDFLYVSVPALHMLILQSKDAYQSRTPKQTTFRVDQHDERSVMLMLELPPLHPRVDYLIEENLIE